MVDELRAGFKAIPYGARAAVAPVAPSKERLVTKVTSVDVRRPGAQIEPTPEFGWITPTARNSLAVRKPGIVTATGIGFPPSDEPNKGAARMMARDAAWAVAARNLLREATPRQVGSASNVKNYAAATDEIETKVQGWIEGAKVTKEVELASGGFEITLEVPFSGIRLLLAAPNDAP